jgi:small subunit ribosomal protein S20
MAITKNAKKAHRQSLQKRVYNLRRREGVARAIKSLKKAVLAGDKKTAEVEMRKVQKALDKAAKENTLKKNTASRKKARLSKLVKSIS